MKIIIAGGSGQVGRALIRHFLKKGHEIVLLSRKQQDIPNVKTAIWDGVNLGEWTQEIEGSDVVINLAGRTVNCRYTKTNLTQMMDSRVNSTNVIGQAIEKATTPPPTWLQMSTATIYAHRFDAPNDEHTGIIGGKESDVPDYWGYSVEIAQAWEKTQQQANTPKTRKVAMRTAMVMTPDKEGIFDVLYNLTRWGLGGTIAGGRQFISWIHEYDFIQALEVLIENKGITGPVNLCAPNPLPQKDFMAQLRKAGNISIGLPATKWMVEIGAFFMRTDTELVLKSRQVIPKRLLDLGFQFQYSHWDKAAIDLVQRWKN